MYRLQKFKRKKNSLKHFDINKKTINQSNFYPFKYSYFLQVMEDSITLSAPAIDSENIKEYNLNFATGDKTVSQITLTRHQCIEPSLLDSFLRTLRHQSDDTIKAKINNYTRSGSTNVEKLELCNTFVKEELYPNWEVRHKAIKFCEQQANKMKIELVDKHLDRPDKKEYNLRLDPYAEKAAKEEYESHFKDLDNVTQWVENNKMVESILQNTSDSILKQRCHANREYLQIFWDNIDKMTEY